MNQHFIESSVQVHAEVIAAWKLEPYEMEIVRRAAGSMFVAGDARLGPLAKIFAANERRANELFTAAAELLFKGCKVAMESEPKELPHA